MDDGRIPAASRRIFANKPDGSLTKLSQCALAADQG
jgi:hypothetical protein